MPLLSIVVPFLDERESAPAFAGFVKRLTVELRDRFGLDTEIVLVDDGSTDDSVARYASFIEGNWKIAELSRNFGKEIALFAGLELAAGDYVMMMDADLQHPYDTCIKLVSELLGDPELDVVYSVRDDRVRESASKAVGSRFFFWLINFRQRFIVPANAGDFRIMRRPVVDAFLRVRDKHRFNKGLYAWAGFRQKGIHYIPDQRANGVSKWSGLALLSLSLEGVTSFSALPLRVVSLCGGIAGLLGMIYGIKIIFEVVFDGIRVPGYPSLMVAVLVLGGLNLVLLGLLGEYLWVNTGETKDRPLYLIRKLHQPSDRT